MTDVNPDKADCITSQHGAVTRPIAVSSVARVNLGKQGEKQGPFGWESVEPSPSKTPRHRKSKVQTLAAAPSRFFRRQDRLQLFGMRHRRALRQMHNCRKCAGPTRVKSRGACGKMTSFRGGMSRSRPFFTNSASSARFWLISWAKGVVDAWPTLLVTAVKADLAVQQTRRNADPHGVFCVWWIVYRRYLTS